MKVYYGAAGKYQDVTEIATRKCLSNGIMRIPKNEFDRCNIFGDPLLGTLKHIKIDEKIYSHEQSICVDYETGESRLSVERRKWWNESGKFISDPTVKLAGIHNYISLSFGKLSEEYPEQMMAATYIRETDTVLEIGANIGRNTCVIASLLNDDTRLITLECCQEYVNQLQVNRDQNDFKFHIEAAALSRVPLMQKGWDTFVCEDETIPTGYTKVNTITFEELQNKYNMKYNVLVADCEGALYQILKDEPNMLQDIETVIIENDFHDLECKKFVDRKFEEAGLRQVYSSSGGWGPCQPFFFQVFSKRDF